MGIVIFGACCFTFAVGSLTSVLSSLDAREAKLKENLEILDTIKKEYKIDTEFYMQLKGALKYDCRKNEIDKYAFANTLPPHLQTELSKIVHKNIISAFPFFKNKSRKFVSDISEMLKPMSIKKGEYIFKEDTDADYIYFLTKGQVDFVLHHQQKDIPYLKIEEGSGLFFYFFRVLFWRVRNAGL
jgi:hypothetical protein